MSDDLFPGFESHWIDTEVGRIFVRSKGSGKPLVLLHGFPQTHAMWHHLAPTLAETHRVVCMDLRGYGWSVFGVIALTILILFGVSLVFGIIDSAIDNRWIGLLFNIVTQTLTAPFVALAWTITYYELRGLKGAEPAPAV